MELHAPTPTATTATALVTESEAEVLHVVCGRLTHREQRLFEEAVMLLLMGSAHRRLTAHKGERS